jgi:hypothetical protein
VTFELEAIDRMYLNAYVTSLQTGGGFAYFLKTQLGVRVPSTVMVAPLSERFVQAIERFTGTERRRSRHVRQGATQGRLSILQAEFALTQVPDRPQTGRGSFEGVIRDNFDIGRPNQMQVIFNRRVTRRTPGSFRTRVLTGGVVPTLHAQYKQAKIKQYHKEGQALRTETTINNIYDFEIGRALRNLPALREIGFAANRRLLRVEYLSHDSLIGDDAADGLTQPVVVDTQRAAALRLGDRRVLALMQVLSLFALHPSGFRHRDVRSAVAQLLGRALEDYGPSQMTYDLRRLRLHGLIERVPNSHRYRITEAGARLAILYLRIYARGSVRPRRSPAAGTRRGTQELERLDAALTKFLEEVRLVA